MTRSSLTASSASVVKVSSTEAKSSAAADLSSAAGGGVWAGSSGGGCLGRLGLVLFCRSRFSFSHDGGGGFGVVGGGLVEQGYASLVTGCGACFADCWTSRLVVVGPPWRVSLDNPSCRTFNREPASNGNSSTIATAREQCQTQIWRMLQPGCSESGFPNERSSANLPCYGLSVDAVALCLRLRDGKDRRVRVLRSAEGR